LSSSVSTWPVGGSVPVDRDRGFGFLCGGGRLFQGMGSPLPWRGCAVLLSGASTNLTPAPQQLGLSSLCPNLNKELAFAAGCGERQYKFHAFLASLMILIVLVQTSEQ
jgi:hypothetical protein